MAVGLATNSRIFGMIQLWLVAIEGLKLDQFFDTINNKQLPFLVVVSNITIIDGGFRSSNVIFCIIWNIELKLASFIRLNNSASKNLQITPINPLALWVESRFCGCCIAVTYSKRFFIISSIEWLDGPPPNKIVIKEWLK